VTNKPIQNLKFKISFVLIYLEKKAKNYPETQRILEKFQSAQILEIDNYKNIFDKNF